MAPSQKEQIERLTVENSELKALVKKLAEHSQQLTERVEKIEAGHEQTIKIIKKQLHSSHPSQ